MEMQLQRDPIKLIIVPLGGPKREPPNEDRVAFATLFSGSGFQSLITAPVAYCCANTPTQPLALCVVQIVPACSGTNTWLLVESTATL